MKKINLSEQLRDVQYIRDVITDMLDKRKEPPKDFPLSVLQEDCSSFEWQPPRRVQIPKSNGKMRDIFIFNDECSFLLKILNAIFVDHFGNYINTSVFSYRKGYRCFNAVDNIRKHLEDGSLSGFKFDIKSYFPSVNQKTIFKCINELVEESDVKGRELLYALFSINCFIDSKTGKYVKQDLGLMPGSALSAFFANYVLHDLDDYLKGHTEVYSRYADDIVIFAKTEEDIHILSNTIADILKNKGLIIHPEKQEFLDSSKPFEFLGLTVSKDSIDISRSTFSKLKKVVYNICKSSRKQVRKNTDLEKHLAKTIARINRKLYYGIFSKSEAHKGSRMNYVFSNVTTDKTLKQFDRYVIDTLNYVVTGKHNRSPKRWNVATFTDLGYYSSVRLWNLYKVNVSVYKNEIFLLNKPAMQEFDYKPRKVFEVPNVCAVKNYFGSFSDLFYSVLKDNNGCFLINKEQVYPEYLTFDIESHILRFKDTVLISEGKLQFNALKVHLNNEWFEYEFTNKFAISNLSKDTSKELFKEFLPASYDMDFSGTLERAYSGFTKMNLWRTFPVNEMLCRYSEDALGVNVPLQVRKIQFISYLFFHIVSKNLWNDLDYSKKYIVVEDGPVKFILKKEWLVS